MRRDKRMRYQYLFRCGQPPFVRSRADQQRSCGGLQARHLMRVAQPAILPRLFFVPMHLNESHAEQHQDCYGASEKALRSAGHTVAMIVPCPWNMQIRGDGRWTAAGKTASDRSG